MKILIFSDAHIHKHSGFATVIDGVHSRVYHGMEVLQQIIDYARSRKIQDIFFLGDMFESKSHLDTSVLELVFNLLYSVKDEFNWYFIPGNHDMSEEGKYNALATFVSIGQVFKQPGQVEVGGKIISMVPFFRKRRDIVQAIQSTPGDILMAHEGIIGAKVEGREICEIEGTKAGITVSEMLSGKHKRVFLGHFHDPLCLTHDKISYVGAIMHMTAGDIGDRGFVIHDLVTGASEFIKTNFPKFKQLDDKDVKNMSTDELYDLCQENYVRFSLTRSNPKVEKLQENTTVLVDIKPKEIVYEQRMEISVFDETKHIIESYVGKFGDAEARDRLISLGMEIVEGTKA